jgi:hypothetical protein
MKNERRGGSPRYACPYLTRPSNPEVSRVACPNYTAGQRLRLAPRKPRRVIGVSVLGHGSGERLCG